jgi:hypothetical protein
MTAHCRPKVLAALEGDDSDSELSSSSSGSKAGSDAEEEAAGAGTSTGPAAKKQRAEVTMEDLEKAGFKSGPSVLFMKAPKEEVQTDWTW